MKTSRRFMSCLTYPLIIALLFISGCSKNPVTYCGEKEKDGPWPECNPERYNTDGPAERLLNKGVSRIIMIDMTVGGVRFSKTFDVVQMTKKAMLAWEKSQAESTAPVQQIPGKIGVIYVVHGGFDTYKPLHLWDSSAQMFSYDPNHPVYKLYLFNKYLWGQILQSGNAVKETTKYDFEYQRIGGTDPFGTLTEQQFQHLKQQLDQLGKEQGLEFELDWAAWMSGDDVSHYAYPRYMFSPPAKDSAYSNLTPKTPLMWINDYTNLMERSYPGDPAGWTATQGAPKKDISVPLAGSPNPVAADPDLATLHVEGIEAAMNKNVTDAETGVIILNHAINDNKEYFDPKIDDTLLINKNIKTQLLSRHPTMNRANIIGAYMGIYEKDPDCKDAVGRTRNMRGENLGYAWLYESAKQMPGDEWGYRYWDALAYLKNRGVKHIVIGFAQIVTDSVLNLIEIQNQIAKEIGTRTWLHAATGDTVAYPGAGNPFADYWGIWVKTDCGGTPCCFTMGGCENGGVYPPPPQKCPRDDMDPSLAYDVSEYGHLGYDPALGPPDTGKPVQQQYTGTWALWQPPNADPRLSKLLAKHVLQAAGNELK